MNNRKDTKRKKKRKEHTKITYELGKKRYIKQNINQLGTNWDGLSDGLIRQIG